MSWVVIGFISFVLFSVFMGGSKSRYKRIKRAFFRDLTRSFGGEATEKSVKFTYEGVPVQICLFDPTSIGQSRIGFTAIVPGLLSLSLGLPKPGETMAPVVARDASELSGHPTQRAVEELLHSGFHEVRVHSESVEAFLENTVIGNDQGAALRKLINDALPVLLKLYHVVKGGASSPRAD